MLYKNNSKSYGEYEDGNQLSFDAFQKYIDQHYPERDYNFKRDGLPQMKEMIKHSLLSVRKKLNPNNREFCFELFGYDFIMDEDLNLWLIEVNTNPCLEESSNMLKYYLRRMVEDMIKLEIDPKFPNPKRYKKSPKDKHRTHDDLNQSQSEKKRQKSASMIHKTEMKRKLSFSRVSSSYQKRLTLQKRGFSKSSASRRMTCRSTNDDSFQPANKLVKNSSSNSLADLKNENNSKDFSMNSKGHKVLVTSAEMSKEIESMCTF